MANTNLTLRKEMWLREKKEKKTIVTIQQTIFIALAALELMITIVLQS